LFSLEREGGKNKKRLGWDQMTHFFGKKWPDSCVHWIRTHRLTFLFFSFFFFRPLLLAWLAFTSAAEICINRAHNHVNGDGYVYTQYIRQVKIWLKLVSIKSNNNNTNTRERERVKERQTEIYIYLIYATYLFYFNCFHFFSLFL
jgi:hypothetical protein